MYRYLKILIVIILLGHSISSCRQENKITKEQAIKIVKNFYPDVEQEIKYLVISSIDKNKYKEIIWKWNYNEGYKQNTYLVEFGCDIKPKKKWLGDLVSELTSEITKGFVSYNPKKDILYYVRFKIHSKDKTVELLNIK